jgi:hypothetical protein
MLKNLITVVVSLGCIASSPAQNWVSDYSVEGATAGETMSSAIIAIGDINGDGVDDFAASSPNDSSVTFRSGSISLFSGADGALIAKRYGEEYAEATGYQLAYLGTYNNDTLALFAASSPFFASSTGPFSGIVRVYSYDLTTDTLDLYLSIDGPSAGQMFGIALIGYQYDASPDNKLELAVSAIGHNALDGAVYIYQIDDTTQTASLLEIVEGAAGQKELLGFSISPAILNGLPTLFMGSPFADDMARHSGAVSVLSSSSGDLIDLVNPFSGVANAHLGYAVAAGIDVTGDGVADFLSSCPSIGNGYLITWNSGSTYLTLEGVNANEAFGSSISIVPDSNFDGLDDVLVGGPQAASNRGRAALHSLSTPDQTEIVSFSGTDADDFFGTTIASISSPSLSPLLIGAVGDNDGAGSITQHSLDIPDITINSMGTYEVLTDVTLQVNDLFDGGMLYFYVGESNSPSTVGNHDLDISGNVQLYATYANSDSVVHQEFTIPETYANGTTLIFQVVEEYNLLTRYSDLVGGTVYVPEVTTMVNGSFEWYTDVTVRASNLFDGGTVYYYVGESYGPSTFGGHDLTISGNVQLIASFVNTSATADVDFSILDSYPDGTEFFFQVVEEYNTLTRYSNISYGTVSEPSAEIITTVIGSFEWYTDVTVRASNLFDGGTVYYYVGENNSPSTFGGHDLNISGNVELISSFVNTSATADVDFSILDSYPDGTNLYFQVVEEYSILTRYSNLSGGTVTEPTTFELFNSGNTAGAQMGLRAVGALPGAVVNFYGTLNSTIDPVDGALISSAVTGSGGSATININVPASMSGATAYLRARDMTNGEKTQILTVVFL